MRTTKITSILIAALVLTCFCAAAQDQKSILDKLQSQYSLTKATADKTDIVTAGSILVLQKDNLMMVPTTSSSPSQNTYKDGRITQAGISKITGFGRHIPGVPQSGSNSRTFVAGEKMWVTKIDARENGAYFELFTDAYGDVRYKATLLFPFAKGTLPPADQVDKVVHEVFKVQPAEESKGSGQPASAGPAPAAAPAAAEAPPAPIAPPAPPPAEAAPALIAPPPPPPEEPKTIALGQTTDQVVGILGQPVRIANLGKKQIYYYKDLKVTFVDHKVTDVQ
jgi:hypothetical protein